MRPDAPRGLYLARDGTWFHDGQGIHHERLAALLHRSIARGDDGALIVTTGRDVMGFEAQDAPFLVREVRMTDALLTLSDGSQETLQGPLHVDEQGRVRVRVKGGRFWALLSRAVAHLVMAGVEEDVDDDGARVRLGGAAFAIRASAVDPTAPAQGWSG